jgi:hypothetical protein
MSDVDWMLNVEGCEFSDENDYAKTVATAGGRFEVLDSDGEVTWISPVLSIDAYDLVKISLSASETGSSSVAEKKYLSAFVLLDDISIPFESVSTVSGNWGSVVMSQSGIVGSTLQLLVCMNSSYANDKVILDDVLVEAIDSSILVPVEIEIVDAPLFAFLGDTLLMRSVVLNAIGERTFDSSLSFNFESANIELISQSVTDGFYSWELVPLNTGNLSYAITEANNLLQGIDSSFSCFSKEDALLNENFETTLSSEWIFQGDWEVSSVEPISGIQSVKHLEQEEGGFSSFIYKDKQIRLSEADYFFSFQLKNGEWDPSSSNAFYFLMSASEDTDSSGAYVIGVNAAGSSDLVSIWAMVDGEVDDLIAETAFDWGENDVAQIDVLHSPRGEWFVSVTDLINGEVFSARGENNDYAEIDHLQLVFNYTASRSGELWFDDLIVLAQNSAPFISDASVLSDGRFSIVFNEAVQMDLIDDTNFKITGKSGEEYSILSIEKVEPNEVILTSANVGEAYLLVSAYSISDEDGMLTGFSSFDLENVLAAEVSDVVFSEIMADPSPQVALPLAEYLEFYNRSSHFIQLENWNLFVRNTELTLPSRLIAPSSFLILCDEDYETDFSVMGEVLVLESFPSLLNSGTTIRLINPDGLVVESISYSDDWYQSSEKDDGGYSLERIDLNRFCGQSQNWIASEDPSGGTPGTINSVDAENIDTIAPLLLGLEVLSYTEILVSFNESLDTIFALDKANFSIAGLSFLSVEYVAGDFTVKLVLQQTLQTNTEYRLLVNEMSDECGNKSELMETAFSIVSLEAGDVLINEVLFNPYTDGSDFVELYNNSGLTIDLAGLKLATRDDVLELKTVYDISSLNVIFPDQSIMALTTDASNIMENYDVPYPENLIEVDQMPSFNNDEGRVVLLNDSLQVLDEFVYNETMHDEWLSDVDGVSLERISFDAETNLESNWHSASSLVGYATPGYGNSQSESEEQQQNAVELESDVVSPNGDGFNDVLLIRFLIDRTGYMANVLVFNTAGREVQRITNNDLIGTNFELSYDLRDGNGVLLPMGMYVLFTELLHSDGGKMVFKNAFLLTDNQ